jgi:hypothetical protein
MESTTAPDFVAPLTAAVADFGPQLLGLGVIGIGISLGIFGLRKGWTVLRGLVK